MKRLRKSILYSIIFHLLILFAGYGIIKLVELQGFENMNLGLVYVGPLENNLYLLALLLILLSITVFTVIFSGILSLLDFYKRKTKVI